MTSAPCPSEEELSRALARGADTRIDWHVARCERCRATQEAFRGAIARARELPASLPDRAGRDEVRASLLARAAMEPVGTRGRMRGIAGLAAVAAALIIAWIAKERREVAPPRSHVVVRAGEGARYEISAPPWETVRLWEGRIDLDVTPLGAGDRVRVQVGDGEVEVRGTRFQVTAREDRLVSVEVTRGRVEVRPIGSGVRVLGAGQTWRVPTPDRAIVASPEIAPSNEARAPAARTPAARTPARPHAGAARSAARVERALLPTRQEQLYNDAWDALRARKFQAAQSGFARALAESPSGSLADEAAFWRATSLARGGEPGKALVAFREFVGQYRSSPRRGEAATILGWLLVDAGRPDEAGPLFRGAADDPDANVRQSARDGLEATTRH